MNGAGYSGTPLPKKLGIRCGTRLAVVNAPQELPAWLGPLPEGVVQHAAPQADSTLVHLFVTRRADLQAQLRALRALLAPDAALWVSWPKKASRVPSEVTEDLIRELALPLGWVDVKVCAVSAVWSGLKLVVRQALR
jgi:hypothetical protein